MKIKIAVGLKGKAVLVAHEEAKESNYIFLDHLEEDFSSYTDDSPFELAPGLYELDCAFDSSNDDEEALITYDNAKTLQLF